MALNLICFRPFAQLSIQLQSAGFGSPDGEYQRQLKNQQ